MKTKRSSGAYFTTGDQWLTKPVREFIAAIPDLKNRVVVDPFVGAGDLLETMRREFGVVHTVGHDIKPRRPEDLYNDSLLSIPAPNGAVVVTNPPWLAAHSAVRLGVWDDVSRYFEHNPHCRDLYEIALDRILSNFGVAVVLLPESYKNDYRLAKQWCVVEANPFQDTDAPLGVACFQNGESRNTDVYLNDDFMGDFQILRKYRFGAADDRFVFNAPTGRIFLKGIDGSKPSDICRFGLPQNFDYTRDIKQSSRLLTRIEAPWLSDLQITELIHEANIELLEVRRQNPLALTAFKGNNSAGRRRRRLDYALARVILTKALNRLTGKRPTA